MADKGTEERLAEEYRDLCMRCMQQKGKHVVCPFCGYDEDQHEEFIFSLQPRTVLHRRYLVGQLLAQGGFGITYVGFDANLHRKVAIKEYFPSVLSHRNMKTSTVVPSQGGRQHFLTGLKLFMDEARSLARFEKHPHIVNVYDFFESHGTGYMIMQFLEGDSLSAYIAKHGGKLSVKQSLALMLPILDALKALHALQLYHRDISPQNIMITDHEVPVLIDFGAARYVVGEQSRSLDVIMKPGYTPFEQLSSRGKIGPWTDIYACGATLYFMMTGTVPPAAADRISKDELIPLERLDELKAQRISAELSDAVLCSLAFGYGDRFQTIDEFEQALKKGANAHQTGSPVPIRKADNKKSPLLTGLKNMFLPVSGAILIVAFLAAGYYFFPLINNIIKTSPVPTPIETPSNPIISDYAIKISDAQDGSIIHPVEGVYYIKHGRTVAVTPEPDLKIECTAIYGKIRANGAVHYTVPDEPGGLDMLTVKFIDNHLQEAVAQKVITIQIL